MCSSPAKLTNQTSVCFGLFRARYLPHSQTVAIPVRLSFAPNTDLFERRVNASVKMIIVPTRKIINWIKSNVSIH